MVISIDDKLYARYKDAADSVKFPGGTEALIVRQLARMSDYAASARLIVLGREPRQLVDRAARLGAILVPLARSLEEPPRRLRRRLSRPRIRSLHPAANGAPFAHRRPRQAGSGPQPPALGG